MEIHPSHVVNGAGQPREERDARPIRPMFLLADSQLLFWKDQGALFLERVRRAVARGAAPRAAYLGASNGDLRDYFDLFVAAMEGIDLRDCRMIPSDPSAADRAFFDQADVILLAGGDVARGFSTFQRNGLAERILARHAEGAVLIGISAGAIQLGQRGWIGGGASSFSTFQLVPWVVAAHDEPEWSALAEVVGAMGVAGRGIGIPSGGGAIVHADLTVEPVRKPLVQITAADGALRRSQLLPGDGRP